MALNDNFIYTPPQQPLEILYEDDDLVVVNKPAGLLSVMGRLPEHQDSAYLRVLEKYPSAKVTHRLDMATSGLLMFAKHRDAEVAVSKMFQARTVKKYYEALVQGKIQAEGSVEVPLITDWENRPRQMVHFELGKPAKTLYQSLHYDAETDQSRVRLEPVTGRSHQLRVHMMHIGHPIMGDKLYHPEPAKFHLKRMALHAAYLAFQHPFHQQNIEIHAEVRF
ncbi:MULTISPECIES: RluA family pseudouridine synthase [Acinetobacter]|uniref:RluA family pseudouridine synthase n=3 Tax=Acinetobacter TaxID=469 RepID=A0A5P1UXE9_9GAMM|nr:MULTISPECIES: RluA family pseudouridine synthase [Acinetobacter]AZN67648.1 RluA family pseudouridine synthase [Acinetobacter haemolyticus]EEH69463.1 pseudouridine synthase, RluA family [Acinetobacter sp. ATCC 27244]EFF84050.1 pseudouridine synthase, RluA family [Acinetobacter haemolyticus ATCC 19194]MCU4387236.1 RluA family pseudouridine synthase [Acinetobacter haemolyticus]NAR51720.1 RNA pseudouridine synthase [Acinetobacter haemolyticus]